MPSFTDTSHLHALSTTILPLSFSLPPPPPPPLSLSISPLKGLTKDHIHNKSKPNPSRRMALSPTTACMGLFLIILNGFPVFL